MVQSCAEEKKSCADAIRVPLVESTSSRKPIRRSQCLPFAEGSHALQGEEVCPGTDAEPLETDEEVVISAETGLRVKKSATLRTGEDLLTGVEEEVNRMSAATRLRTGDEASARTTMVGQ
jgi:hypothetical protein